MVVRGLDVQGDGDSLDDAVQKMLDHIQATGSDSERLKVLEGINAVDGFVKALNESYPGLGGQLLASARGITTNVASLAAILGYVCEQEFDQYSAVRVPGMIAQVATPAKLGQYHELFFHYLREFGDARTSISTLVQQFNSVVIRGVMPVMAQGNGHRKLARTVKAYDDSDYDAALEDLEDETYRGAMERYRDLTQQYGVDLAKVEEFLDVHYGHVEA